MATAHQGWPGSAADTHAASALARQAVGKTPGMPPTEPLLPPAAPPSASPLVPLRPRSQARRLRVSRRRLLAGLALGSVGLVSGGLAASVRWGPVERQALSLSGRNAPEPSAAQRPATYFLQEAGQRAFASLLARLDPAAGYRPYFALDLSGPVPVLKHDVWDWIDMTGRAVDGFARLRLLTGTTAGAEQEAAVRALLLAQQGDDGLLWNGPAPDGQYASNTVEIFSQSRGLLALNTWFAVTGSAAIEDAIEQLVRGLDAIAVHEDGTARYPGTQWRNGWLDYTNTPEGAPEGRAKWGLGALVALPLLEHHARTGSPAAGALGRRLLAYFADRSGLVAPSGAFHGHVHAEGYAGLATAAVYQARLDGREDRLRWAERVYAYIRANATAYGWFPDAMHLGEQHYWYWYHVPWLPPTCETCALADVLQLAIALAESGYPEYWDDVERFARNHLLASQFPAELTFLAPAARDTPGARALAGSFGSATLPQSLLGYLYTGTEPIIEGCCTGSGARALHLVWEHTATDRAGELWVHLGFSGPRPAAEIVGYEPYEGRREVRLRAPRHVFLRAPARVRREDVQLWIDGKRHDVRWAGGYVDAGPLGAGQVAALRYPLALRSEREEVNRQPQLVGWKGDTVLEVWPPGSAPVPYQRTHLAQAPLAWQPAPMYPPLGAVLSPFA